MQHLTTSSGVLEELQPPVSETAKSGDDETNSILDLGTMGMAETRNFHFSVVNENPVSLNLQGWGSNVSWCNVELLRVAGRPVQHSNTHSVGLLSTAIIYHNLDLELFAYFYNSFVEYVE